MTILHQGEYIVELGKESLECEIHIPFAYGFIEVHACAHRVAIFGSEVIIECDERHFSSHSTHM